MTAAHDEYQEEVHFGEWSIVKGGRVQHLQHCKICMICIMQMPPGSLSLALWQFPEKNENIMHVDYTVLNLKRFQCNCYGDVNTQKVH